METTELTKERINWKSEESVKEVAFCMSGGVPVSATKIAESLSELKGKRINSYQIKNSILMLKEILGHENMIEGNKFLIRNLSKAEEMIESYFKEINSKSKNKKVELSEERSLEQKLSDYKKLEKVFNITSNYGSKGILSPEFYQVYKAVFKVKTANSTTLNNIIELINKYQIPGFTRVIVGNKFKIYFYSDRSKDVIVSRIKNLENKLGISEDTTNSVEEVLQNEDAKPQGVTQNEVDIKSEMIKILYLKSQKGMSVEEISKEIFLRLGGRRLSNQEIESYLDQFKSDIDPEIFRYGFNNYKILDYSRAIQEIVPSKSRMNFSIKVPINVSLRKTLEGVNFEMMDEVDRDKDFIYYDISAKNSSVLLSGLIRLVLGFNVVIVSEESESVCISKNKSVILTRSIKNKVDKRIEEILKLSDDVL